ncbi:unnamed protein product [Blumeria hordei]|uniref:Thiol methyltransferase n=1 Tax=Blumeria hordei TaxID=2867405 RepID=A0A383V035_BLUHO|nr:unnamed protein product [Blumeria hordei]
MTEELGLTRSKLQSHFAQGKGVEGHNVLWEALWKEGYHPWDRNSPNPALIDLLNERREILPSSHGANKRKALVPGCGRGYDVLLLAADGYDSYGLDTSRTAIKEAKKLEAQLFGYGVYATGEGIHPGKITWIEGDFFSDETFQHQENEDKFDLIYDYTFLSALPPTLRPAWSKRMVELLAEGGRLICVEFPTYKPHSTGGPPWALPPIIYEAHLTRPGRDLEYDEVIGLLEQKIGDPDRRGLRRITHFQPARTHEVGYSSDGKVTDWISIWAHAIGQ